MERLRFASWNPVMFFFCSAARLLVVSSPIQHQRIGKRLLPLPTGTILSNFQWEQLGTSYFNIGTMLTMLYHGSFLVDLMVIHGDLMGIKSTVNYAPNI
jgi:hypothetical protein